MDTKETEEMGIGEVEEAKREKVVPPPSPRKSPTELQEITGNRDKMTYVFHHEGEVGCVHYDELRGEIYINGHNARTMTLTEKEWQILEEFRIKLRHHPKFCASSYTKALTQLAREKKI